MSRDFSKISHRGMAVDQPDKLFYFRGAEPAGHMQSRAEYQIFIKHFRFKEVSMLEDEEAVAVECNWRSTPISLINCASK